MTMRAICLACLLFLAAPTYADADDSNTSAWAWDGHFQSTVIPQGHGPFDARYNGGNSLFDRTEVDASLTSTLFLGTRLLPGLELYVDPELTGGNGLSDTRGIAGFPNGEISHVNNPALQVNVARAYIQWTLGLGSAMESVASDQNQLAESRALSRLTLAAGKFSLTDFFDANTYSHDPRNQFLNLSLEGMGAWDYAADVRGYTQGIYGELDESWGTLRFAEVLLPTAANGPDLDNDIVHTRSTNVEADRPWTLAGRTGALRLLGYLNQAPMGDYRETLDTPSDNLNVSASSSPGAKKYGLGLNLEQQISGSSGVFLRLSWNDGATQTWAFTEIDRSASLGTQISGALWGRGQDRMGIGLAVDGLSPSHEEYLAAGGYGFIIGDGALNYGLEQIAELYYDWNVIGGLSLSPDFQFVLNPAYNRDRGPVEIYGIRAHFEI